jgi:hypothetical protein
VLRLAVIAPQRHVPGASLVVGHPQEGVFSFSGLFADGGLELAINGTVEVADVGPEPVGGPPVHELPVGLSTWAGAVPAFQIGAFGRWPVSCSMCSIGAPTGQSAASPQLNAMVAPRCPKLSELTCGFVGSRRSLI